MPEPRYIANAELQLADVPPPDADWNTLTAFALSFNGYQTLGSFEVCAEIANARKSDTLTNLRACLFFEQRRWRHFGEHPDSEAMSYIRGIVEQIRQKIVGDDRQ